jgi:hypothetical protein
MPACSSMPCASLPTGASPEARVFAIRTLMWVLQPKLALRFGGLGTRRCIGVHASSTGEGKLPAAFETRAVAEVAGENRMWMAPVEAPPARRYIAPLVGW